MNHRKFLVVILSFICDKFVQFYKKYHENAQKMRAQIFLLKFKIILQVFSVLKYSLIET